MCLGESETICQELMKESKHQHLQRLATTTTMEEGSGYKDFCYHFSCASVTSWLTASCFLALFQRSEILSLLHGELYVWVTDWPHQCLLFQSGQWSTHLRYPNQDYSRHTHQHIEGLRPQLEGRNKTVAIICIRKAMQGVGTMATATPDLTPPGVTPVYKPTDTEKQIMMTQQVPLSSSV